MRDIVLVLIFVGAIPYMLKRPSLGVIMWIWLSVMNPHRLAYGFAYDMSFALGAAVVTVIGLLTSKEERKLDFDAPVKALAFFAAWMCITSLFPFHPGSGFDLWSRIMKIMFMTFVACAVIRSKEQIHWVVWVIVGSLGFYGAKGGFFTATTGGNYLVWGPAGSFIEGNNEMALAMVMVIPLMRYVSLTLQKKWQKWGMNAVMGFTALSALGSHSRGALLALAAMGLFLWWRSRNKVVMGVVLATVGLAMISFMPPEWMNRMNTIKTYEEDGSAMGRINAWHMAFNMACARPLGGGFDIYDFETFGLYAPNPLDVHAAHSIYFQILGEHGFIGLFLFLMVGVTTWVTARKAKREAKGVAGLEWVGPLVDMMTVSMIGYAVGGAFLSLAYFDVPYYVMVLAVAIRRLVRQHGNAPVPERAKATRRSDRFGLVTIVDDQDNVPETAPQTAPRRPGDWTGGFVKPALSSRAEKP